MLEDHDIRKIVTIGGKKVGIYDGVIYREKFEKSPFKKIIEKVFALGKKCTDKGNDLKQRLVKLIMNSIYGVQIRKDINEIYKSKSESWMSTEYDDNVLHCRKLPNGKYIVKFKKMIVQVVIMM